MIFVPFELLQLIHSGWMLLMSFDPPRANGIIWSAVIGLSELPQAKQVSLYLEHNALNCSPENSPHAFIFLARRFAPYALRLAG